MRVHRQGILVVAKVEVDRAEGILQLRAQLFLLRRNRVETFCTAIDQVAHAHLFAFGHTGAGAAKKVQQEILYRGRGARFALDLRRLPSQADGTRQDHDQQSRRRSERQPVSAHEFAQLVRARAAADRAAIQERAQILSHRADRRVACFRRFRHRALDDALQIAAQCALERRGRARARCGDGISIGDRRGGKRKPASIFRRLHARAIDCAIQRLGRFFQDRLGPAGLAKRSAPVWQASTKQKVQNYTKAVDVSCRGHRFAEHLLRRRVLARHRPRVCVGQFGAVGIFYQRFGDAEVEQLGFARGRHQDVRWFQIAMHDQVAMRVLHRVADFQQQLHAPADIQALPIAPLRDRLAVDEFEGEIRRAIVADAAIVQLRDVRMGQPGQRVAFAQEAQMQFRGSKLLADQLEC